MLLFTSFKAAFGGRLGAAVRVSGTNPSITRPRFLKEPEESPNFNPSLAIASIDFGDKRNELLPSHQGNRGSSEEMAKC